MEPEPAPNWSIPDVLFTAVNEVITNAYTPFYPDNSNISKPATSMLAQWEKPTQLFAPLRRATRWGGQIGPLPITQSFYKISATFDDTQWRASLKELQNFTAQEKDISDGRRPQEKR